METLTRIINYHLKGCIEGKNSKITLSGSNVQGDSLKLPDRIDKMAI